MKDYEIETIAKIRELGTEVSKISDENLCVLYSYFSEEQYCAGWMAYCEDEFYEWLVTSPINNIKFYGCE